jgi:tyrosinase
MAQFVRVDVWSLAPDDPIVAAYAGAVAAMKAKPISDPTSWAFQGAMHGTHAAHPQAEWNQCRHQTWNFVSWHRMYLYYFERIVRAQVVALGGPSTWALPYWNYDGGTNHNQIPLAFRSPTLADRTPNALFEGNRDPAINAGAGLPSSITSPSFAMSSTTFTGASEFGGGVTSAIGQFLGQTGRLEQTPHNDVHSTIGGLMGDPDAAALDPIFWLHHANIDRLWWLWEKQFANPTDPAWANASFSFVDADGSNASLTGANVEKTLEQLDYTYDHLVLRIPWHPRRVRFPLKWPWPWPERPPDLHTRPPEEVPGEPLRHLVGATEKPISLVGAPLSVPVSVDTRVAETLNAEAETVPHQHRAFLDIDNIDAKRNPGKVYGIYVNLPKNPTAEDIAAHHVGNVSLFGVERARNPRGDEHAHGLHLSMEITSLLDKLASEGTWTEGEKLDVAFRPIGLEPPPGVSAEAMQAESLHPDQPITIGRVSLHYA